MELPVLKPGTLVGTIYEIVRLFGSGSFANIYLGMNIKNGEDVAVKVESTLVKYPQIQHEYDVFKEVQGPGLPQVKAFARAKTYNALVLNLLGPSLEDLLNFCNRHFSLNTILRIADQLLVLLEFVHEHSFIHRDIKPDNLLIGIGHECNRIFLIDFGLAKRYRDVQNNHISYREDKKLAGTARYCSIYNHLGIEQSRRDDIENLGYVLVYFNCGSLPWQGLKAATKQQKYEKIIEKKLSTPVEILCKGLPQEFTVFLNYTRGLEFEDRPDYAYLQQMFRSLLSSLKPFNENSFDWSLIKKNYRKLQMKAFTNGTDETKAEEIKNE